MLVFECSRMKKVRHQLQRVIFKRCGRPVKQFKDEFILESVRYRKNFADIATKCLLSICLQDIILDIGWTDISRMYQFFQDSPRSLGIIHKHQSKQLIVAETRKITEWNKQATITCNTFRHNLWKFLFISSSRRNVSTWLIKWLQSNDNLARYALWTFVPFAYYPKIVNSFIEVLSILEYVWYSDTGFLPNDPVNLIII